MSNAGELESGFKSPTNGSINVPANSPICFYFDGVENPDFDEANLWVGGLQVLINGTPIRGWELLERGCVSGRMYIKIRYRGNMPSSHIFCYAKYKNKYAKCHFFVVGASSGGQIILNTNKFDRFIGSDDNDYIAYESKKSRKNSVSIVNGDIFFGDKYVLTIPDGISYREIIGNKCHIYMDKCIVEHKWGLLMMSRDIIRRIKVDEPFSVFRNGDRIDILLKNTPTSHHIYLRKNMEPIDQDGDVFTSTMEGCEKYISGDIRQIMNADTKVCFDQNVIIAQMDFEPICGRGDHILWRTTDMDISRIDEVQIADLGNLYVRCGQEKRLINLWTPEVVKV